MSFLSRTRWESPCALWMSTMAVFPLCRRPGLRCGMKFALVYGVVFVVMMFEVWGSVSSFVLVTCVFSYLLCLPWKLLLSRCDALRVPCVRGAALFVFCTWILILFWVAFFGDKVNMVLIVPLFSFHCRWDVPFFAVSSNWTDMLLYWKLVVDELETFAESPLFAMERMILVIVANANAA